MTDLEVGNEVSCMNCVAACCTGVSLLLTDPEHEQMIGVGTQLTRVFDDETLSDLFPSGFADTLFSSVSDPWSVRVALTGMIALRSARKSVRSEGDEEVISVSLKVQEAAEGRRGVYLMEGSCGNLDPASGLCTIYDQRPAVCRDTEMGGENCIELRENRAVAVDITACPPE